jgi:hypothetical protein
MEYNKQVIINIIAAWVIATSVCAPAVFKYTPYNPDHPMQ